MPIPGIFASQITGHLGGPVGAYDALASVTLAATTTTVTFSGIPQNYKSLELRTSWFTTVNGSYMYEYYNNDTTSPDYNRAAFYGAAASGSGGSYSAANAAANSAMDYADLQTYPSMRISQYLDYTNSNKNKTILSITGRCYSSTQGACVQQGTMWQSLSPITSITLVSDNAMAIGSTFSLYGVK